MKSFVPDVSVTIGEIFPCGLNVLVYRRLDVDMSESFDKRMCVGEKGCDPDNQCFIQ